MEPSKWTDSNQIQRGWCEERFKNLKNDITKLEDIIIPNLVEKINIISERVLKRSSDFERLNKVETEIYGNGKNGIKSDLNYLYTNTIRRDKIQTLLFVGFILQILTTLSSIFLYFFMK